MTPPRFSTVPKSPVGRGVVVFPSIVATGQPNITDESSTGVPAKVRQQRSVRDEPTLSVGNTFTDEAVQGLIDELIVPVIVDRLITSMLESPAEREELLQTDSYYVHNNSQGNGYDEEKLTEKSERRTAT